MKSARPFRAEEEETFWRIPCSFKLLGLLVIVVLFIQYSSSVLMLRSPPPPGVQSEVVYSLSLLSEGNSSSGGDLEVNSSFRGAASEKLRKETCQILRERLDDNSAQPCGNETSERKCPLIPPRLVGPLKVLLENISFEDIEALHQDVELGGKYRPKECAARHKVALIVPYRDREEHLRKFLHNLHPMLKRQQLDYEIFVVEQSGTSGFNRAKLMNIGFLEANKIADFECYIFHDVDLIPEDDRNIYSCPDQPRHMSVAVDSLNYKLPYPNIFGGVSALSRKHMELVNGFSNEYWGWGAEDDDMSARVRFYHLKITRYPASIARYKMLKHKKDKPSPERYKFLRQGRLRYKRDGLISCNYKVLEIDFKKLYTWILVNPLEPKARKG